MWNTCQQSRKREFARWLAGVLAVGFVFWCAGCGTLLLGGQDFEVWAVDDTLVAFPDLQPERESELFSASSRVIRLEGAVNETVSFQLLLRSGAPVRVDTVRVGGLQRDEDVIPADRVRTYRQIRLEVKDYPVWYLRLTPYLRAPRSYPDILVPLSAPSGALPIHVGPERCEAVWVDIAIPLGTEPGTYTGTVTIAGDANIRREFQLLVNVWPFALPQTRHLPILAGLDVSRLIERHLAVDDKPYSPAQLRFGDALYEQSRAVVDETAQLVHTHRCTPILRDVRPIRDMGIEGEMKLDWADYDALVAGVLDGSTFEDRATAPAWPMPLDERDPKPQIYGGWGSPRYQEMIGAYVREVAKHFEENGWLDRHYIHMALPASDRGERYQQFARLAQAVQQGDARARLVCPLTSYSMAPYGWLDDPFLDVSKWTSIWCPVAERLDVAEIARQQEAGKPTWLQPGKPPYSGSLSVVAPPPHVRSLAWQAYRMGCSGLFLPTITNWSADGLVVAEGSETSLLWPGKAYGLGGPVPSIRLKRLLRAAQDYEYLWLLERNRRPAIARLIAADLFRFGGTGCYGDHCLDGRSNGWVSDAGAWGLARRLMARELIAAIESSGGGGAESEDDIERFERQIEWAHLIGTARQMDAEVEGIRVHFTSGRDRHAVKVAATVSVFNAQRRAFRGTLDWINLPPGWQAQEEQCHVADLAPGRRTRRVIGASTARILARPEGYLPVEMELKGGDLGSVRVSGRLCVLTAQRVNRELRIDGDLRDWPLASNVATDFILVGATDVPKTGRSSPDLASRLTTVFACHDEQYLYLAFNCADDDPADRAISQSNTVRYEDLWPVGEDLVEVVLDPSGKALGPGDLYHIVVKSNGAVVAERGAECLTRVAACRDWPADIQAAIDDRTQPDRWTVEIRIPLESLGDLAGAWGVNFARFDARRGEYASWSPVRSHLYSPVSLGNIRLE